MEEFEVSRTVVREAISKLQAAGSGRDAPRHRHLRAGRGADAPSFKITPEQFSTLQDVIAVLELRIGLETEAAGLAAQRRTADNLVALAQGAGHGHRRRRGGARTRWGRTSTSTWKIARATQNAHFAELMATLGSQIIPRARLEPAIDMSAERQAYMRRVNAEHESILDAIARARTPSRPARPCAPTCPTAANADAERLRPLARSRPAERRRAQSVPRGDGDARGIQPLAHRPTGRLGSGPALGPKMRFTGYP